MNSVTLGKKVYKHLVQDAIICGDEDVAVFVMQKKEKIIQRHVNEVYPIMETKEGGFYTKLTPEKRGHEHKISAKDIDTLRVKIIAYYLEIESKAISMEEALEKAIECCTPQTALRHRQILKQHFSSIKDKSIDSVTEADIRKCLQAMVSKGITSKGFNNATSTLKKINDYCVYEHLDVINLRDKIDEFRRVQMTGKKAFKKVYKSPSVLSFNESEAVAIYKYALDNPDDVNLAIAFLIVTGLRIGELLALTINDVNLGNRTVLINKMERRSTREIVNSAKDHSDRLIFLNDDAIRLMEIILKEKANYLFMNPNTGEKMHLDTIAFRLARIQTRDLAFANPAVRSPHDCRRTYASIQYMHGVDIMTIQAQLGHRNVQQTWDYIKDIVEAENRLQKIEKGCIYAG